MNTYWMAHPPKPGDSYIFMCFTMRGWPRPVGEEDDPLSLWPAGPNWFPSFMAACQSNWCVMFLGGL